MLGRLAIVFAAVMAVSFIGGCNNKTTGDRVEQRGERTGEQVERRTDQEIDRGVDRALDRLFN